MRSSLKEEARQPTQHSRPTERHRQCRVVFYIYLEVAYQEEKKTEGYGICPSLCIYHTILSDEYRCIIQHQYWQNQDPPRYVHNIRTR